MAKIDYIKLKAELKNALRLLGDADHLQRRELFSPFCLFFSPVHLSVIFMVQQFHSTSGWQLLLLPTRTKRYFRYLKSFFIIVNTLARVVIVQSDNNNGK